MKRTLIVGMLVLSFTLPAAAQSFNFGITPTQIDEGVKEPGDTFHVSFYTFSTSSDDMTVDINTGDPSIEKFRSVKGSATSNYSQQDCEDCIRILQGGGTLDERDDTLQSDAANTNRWREVEFLVTLPSDIEPGHHMLEIVPQPRRETNDGSVNLVSTSSLPVTFQVPGRAVRNGKIIGLRAGKHVNGQQYMDATFYNSGTVTMEVNMEFDIQDGSTINAGSQKVSPGGSKDFKAAIDGNSVGENFSVSVTADYTTGTTTEQAVLTKKEPETVETPTGKTQEDQSMPYATAIITVILTSLITWRVVRHVRRP